MMVQCAPKHVRDIQQAIQIRNGTCAFSCKIKDIIATTFCVHNPGFQDNTWKVILQTKRTWHILHNTHTEWDLTFRLHEDTAYKCKRARTFAGINTGRKSLLGVLRFNMITNFRLWNKWFMQTWILCSLHVLISLKIKTYPPRVKK
jgi:hypothetical protein